MYNSYTSISYKSAAADLHRNLKPLQRMALLSRGFRLYHLHRWTLHEHLLFQRRLCRKGVAVMSKQNPRVKALCLDPRVFCMYTC